MVLLDAGAEALGIVVPEQRLGTRARYAFVPAAYDLVLQAHLARVRAGTADADKLLKDMQDLDIELFPGFFRDMRFSNGRGRCSSCSSER